MAGLVCQGLHFVLFLPITNAFNHIDFFLSVCPKEGHTAAQSN